MCDYIILSNKILPIVGRIHFDPALKEDKTHNIVKSHEVTG
jgi:hypothetical protein